MRLHQPVGIWLLLWPCLVSAALAAGGFPGVRTVFLFAFGAVVMRGAGCVINDMADREFDKLVERTRNRPLASGEISIRGAWALLVLLLAAGGLALLFMPLAAVITALFSLPMIAAYPFMKRITYWPQAFLGLTFNFGALIGWAFMRGAVEIPAILLYLGFFFWTLGYDTIYAHQDKTDDALIGVKSTALLLGGNTGIYVAGFYLAFLTLVTASGVLSDAGWEFYCGVVAALALLAWQVMSLEINSPENCRARFKLSSLAGAALFVGACL